MIEKIFNGEEVIAIIIKNGHKLEGNSIQFITTNDYIMQLGMMNRPKDYLVPPHVHLDTKRNTTGTQEVLFIKKGIVELSLYTSEGKFIESRIAEAGDFILFAGGGHGIKILEESEIIEVKNGPYDPIRDKAHFFNK